MQLSTKHLLGIRDLQAGDIQLILDTATQFKEVLQRPIKKVPTLRDVTIVNLFYENSTRTRISFELAEKRLSADTINFTASALPLQRVRPCLTRSIISFHEGGHGRHAA